MKFFNTPLKIRTSLFIIGIILISIIFWINNSIINDLRKHAKSQIENIAKAYQATIQSDDININELSKVLESINFPIIITFEKQYYGHYNIDSLNKNDSNFYNHVKNYIKTFDELFEPLPILQNNLSGFIHYGDPIIVYQLKWMPFLEVGFAIIFIVLFIFGYKMIRESEKNYIWAGMARETAHQLGTPITSLLGWRKLLEDNKINKKMILDSISEDINRLSQISDRFYKIGTTTKLININLNEIINEVVQYITTRSSKNVKANINIISKEKYYILGDRLLFMWAIENIIKNSFDSCVSINIIPNIKINCHKLKNKLIIDISDNGKGIARYRWNEIFNPGFSSKKRGWGLGLSLSRRIIEDIHHGNIHVLKSKQGATTIRIMLYQ